MDVPKDGCASLGAEYILAGITQGNVCLCGKSDSGKDIIFRTEEFNLEFRKNLDLKMNISTTNNTIFIT